VHLVRVIKQTVVHLVLSRFLLEGHEGLKSMPPQDLVGQIGGPGLRCHSRGLYHAWRERVKKKMFLKRFDRGNCNFYGLIVPKSKRERRQRGEVKS
jgi:hypothetical protein